MDEYRYWILGDDGRTPVLTTDAEQWRMLQMYPEMRRVELFRGAICGYEIEVSTVFLADISFLGTPVALGGPWLFETMVFGEPYDQLMTRYQSYDQAERGHRNAVMTIRHALRRRSDRIFL